MADDPIREMPREAFDAWAAHMDIDTDPEHLDKLYPEAAALLRRMATAHGIDTSEVDPAEASQTVPRDMAQGEPS